MKKSPHTFPFWQKTSFSTVQSVSHVWPFATPWTAAHQASLSITNSRSLLKFMSTELVIHPTISSSAIPFSSCLQSFPAPGSFQMSQFFASSGQIIGVSASASVLSMNISSLGGHVFPFQLLWAKCPYQKHVRNTSTWPFHDLDPQLHSSKCDIWLEGPRETDLVLKKMK